MSTFGKDRMGHSTFVMSNAVEVRQPEISTFTPVAQPENEPILRDLPEYQAGITGKLTRLQKQEVKTI